MANTFRSFLTWSYWTNAPHASFAERFSAVCCTYGFLISAARSRIEQTTLRMHSLMKHRTLSNGYGH
ncbi:Unknown protein sequence [Pseudomonas syringae pv. maculicola]|nr:Unknown protein sequence [Pseudomonas syringae pv. maculicola]